MCVMATVTLAPAAPVTSATLLSNDRFIVIPVFHDNELFAPDLPKLLDCIDHPLIFPGVKSDSINWFLVREDILNIFEKISAALFQYRRQDRRYAKDLGCFGQANYVVDQQSPVDVLNTGELKGLVVDEYQCAVLRGEKVVYSCVAG